MADNRIVRSPGRGGGRSRSPRRATRPPVPPPAPSAYSGLLPAGTGGRPTAVRLAGPTQPRVPPPAPDNVLRLLEDMVSEQRRAAARLNDLEEAARVCALGLRRMSSALAVFAPEAAEAESGEDS